MSARSDQFKLVKKNEGAQENSSARGETYVKLSDVDDALALLADAQRRINTAQEQIDKARKILKAT